MPAENASLNKLQIAARSEIPLKGKQEIFVSYALGDDSLETARKREEIVDRLSDTLANEGWNFIRDKSNKTKFHLARPLRPSLFGQR